MTVEWSICRRVFEDEGFEDFPWALPLPLNINKTSFRLPTGELFESISLKILSQYNDGVNAFVLPRSYVLHTIEVPP